jgi:hypothetical protein
VNAVALPRESTVLLGISVLETAPSEIRNGIDDIPPVAQDDEGNVRVKLKYHVEKQKYDALDFPSNPAVFVPPELVDLDLADMVVHDSGESPQPSGPSHFVATSQSSAGPAETALEWSFGSRRVTLSASVQVTESAHVISFDVADLVPVLALFRKTADRTGATQKASSDRLNVHSNTSLTSANEIMERRQRRIKFDGQLLSSPASSSRSRSSDGSAARSRRKTHELLEGETLQSYLAHHFAAGRPTEHVAEKDMPLDAQRVPHVGPGAADIEVREAPHSESVALFDRNISL